MTHVAEFGETVTDDSEPRPMPLVKQWCAATVQPQILIVDT